MYRASQYFLHNEGFAFSGSRSQVYCLENNYPRRWSTNTMSYYIGFYILGEVGLQKERLLLKFVQRYCFKSFENIWNYQIVLTYRIYYGLGITRKHHSYLRIITHILW